MLKQLARIELLKNKRYSTFWAILIIHASLYMLVMLIGSNLSLEINGFNVLDFFKPKYLWGTTAWIASWFNLIIGVLVIILVGNEMQYGTIRRQLIDGITRTQIVVAKLLIAIAFTIYIIVLVFITGIVTSIFTPQGLSSCLFINFKVIFILGIQSFGYMVIAILFALLLKSNALSTILYLLYFIMIEPIIRIFIPSPIDYYLPIKTISHLTPTPNFLEMLSENCAQIEGFDPNTAIQLHNASAEPTLNTTIMVSAIYIACFLITIFLIVRKKDY